MLATLYGTGLRVSELCALQIPDIESQRMVIRVRQAKGQRDRLVMLSPRLLQLLRGYWKQYQPSVWLFPGRTLTIPITHDSVRSMCRHAGELAQIPHPVCPHLLRNASTYCYTSSVLSCKGNSGSCFADGTDKPVWTFATAA